MKNTKTVGALVTSKAGFTLVELLIVIVIMGILASIAVPMYIGQRTKAMMAEAESTLQMIMTLQEAYYAENGRYAPWINKSNFTEENQYMYYAASTTNMSTYLTGFKTGKPEELMHEYYCVSKSQGQAFICQTRGKSGAVKGTSLKLTESGTIDKGTWN